MKMTKRAICLALAVIMALALTIPVLAMDEPVAAAETGKVTLNAGEGTFSNGNHEYSVDVTEGKLPLDLPVPEREGWTFKGWYTAKPTEGKIEKVTSDEGYSYYREVYRANGDEVKAGGTVLPGSTLYAYYAYQTVELKLDANGWNNIFGALTCTRRADSVISKDDLIVVNMTHDSNKNVINWNHTKFDGWWTTKGKGGEQITPDGETTFGQLAKRGITTLYAHWHNETMGVTQDDATENYDVTKPTGELIFGKNITVKNYIHCGDKLDLTVTRNNGSLSGIKWTTSNEDVVTIIETKPDGSGVTIQGVGTDDNTSREAKVTATLGNQSVSVTVYVGHKFGERTLAYPAKCTERGQEYRYCEICREKVHVYLPELGHNYTTKKTVPATCTEAEQLIETCSRCGHVETTTKGEPAGHKYDSETKTSCGGGEFTVKTCSVCGYSITEGNVGAGDHEWVEKIDVEATCAHPGSKSLHCAKCGATKDPEPIAALTTHSYGSWKTVKPATIYETGTEERVCKVCKVTETQEIPKRSNIPGGSSGGGGGGSVVPETTPTPEPSPSPEVTPTPDPESTPTPAPAPVDPPKANNGTGWVYDEQTGTDYYFIDGQMKRNYWAADASASKWNFWYYVDEEGKLVRGLQYIENPNGTGWYMLQVDDKNGCRGRLLDGVLDTGIAGTGRFVSTRGVDYGKCTWTKAWGSYNAATGLWSDGQSHR